jgi:predicted ArsR family transcriptional regulator
VTSLEASDQDGPAQLPDSELGLDRDVFFRSLLRVLAGTLEEVVGLDDAEGLVSVVGGQIGGDLDARYRAALQVERLTPEQVSQVLVDLKRRIGGDFSVESQDETRIVLTNRACPFGEKVVGRPSLCMMTSNVFGAVAAENLGYARVDLEETIAQGAPGCRVVVHLVADDNEGPGREYFPRGGRVEGEP